MAAGDPPLTPRDLDAMAVTRLRGVGEAKAKGLASMGIETLLDLLHHYPRRYIDRTRQASIGELNPGEEATVVGEIKKVSSRKARNRRSIITVLFGDSTGTLSLTFFNQPWREKQFVIGASAIVFGKVDVYNGRLQMSSPVVDMLGDLTARILPVYPQSEKAKLSTLDFMRFVEEALKRSAPRGFDDPLPDEIRSRFSFVSRNEAVTTIHMPDSLRGKDEARRRLVFDELLRVQLELVRRKRQLEATTVGIAHQVDGDLVRSFHQRLPFELTGAQQRAIAEINEDLAAGHPMHRLLQGDVGAGKTLVAVSALLVAVQGGGQGALMAPTEVLAEQHYIGIRQLLDSVMVPDPTTFMGERPIEVALLTNTVGATKRREVLAGLVQGKVDILIGTHALIQDKVEYESLGVVVIDEQHRFGVEQRAALRDKGIAGAQPDVLVMTATPIPRTAAMTVYGDLDVSVLDELPPGRTPIVTAWAQSPLEEAGVWADVRTHVEQGHQAYVVTPLIDESEALDVRSAEETFAELANGELSDLRLGLLHGRMVSADKEETMNAFRDGAIDVLVATTVIEVGVDVPNATVMVIVDADRFGIAQLHQLRGRVGRGAAASVCHLIAEPSTSDGVARLEAIVASTDGFELAEIDLDLRGEGTIMGERQKGRNDLRLASLRRDREWVERAREVAIELIDIDPDLDHHRGLADEVDLLLGSNDAEFLFKS